LEYAPIRWGDEGARRSETGLFVPPQRRNVQATPIPIAERAQPSTVALHLAEGPLRRPDGIDRRLRLRLGRELHRLVSEADAHAQRAPPTGKAKERFHRVRGDV